jgi:protein-S-isoprenylcysteine O-methyltransferase Ste14
MGMTLVRGTLVMVGTAAYLGLAILGWGRWTAFFAHPARVALLGLFAGYLPAATDRWDVWTLDGDLMRWLGVGLFAAGGALRIWPVFVLGRRFSGLVAIQPGHTLVTTGVYGVIRHPSYLGLLVNALGWGFAFRAGVGVVLTARMLPPLLTRIHAEERRLRTQFGDTYLRRLLHPNIPAHSRAL